MKIKINIEITKDSKPVKKGDKPETPKTETCSIELNSSTGFGNILGGLSDEMRAYGMYKIQDLENRRRQEEFAFRPEYAEPLGNP